MITRRQAQIGSFAAAVVLVGLALAVHAQNAPATQPAGATGTWKWSFEGFGGTVEVVLKLKQDGEKLTGTITGFQGDEQEIQDGKIKDGQISFKIVRDFNGQQSVTTYTGKLTGDSLKGESVVTFTRPFEAKRS